MAIVTNASFHCTSFRSILSGPKSGAANLPERTVCTINHCFVNSAMQLLCLPRYRKHSAFRADNTRLLWPSLQLHGTLLSVRSRNFFYRFEFVLIWNTEHWSDHIFVLCPMTR